MWFIKRHTWNTEFLVESDTVLLAPLKTHGGVYLDNFHNALIGWAATVLSAVWFFPLRTLDSGKQDCTLVLANGAFTSTQDSGNQVSLHHKSLNSRPVESVFFLLSTEKEAQGCVHNHPISHCPLHSNVLSRKNSYQSWLCTITDQCSVAYLTFAHLLIVKHCIVGLLQVVYMLWTHLSFHTVEKAIRKSP